MTLPNWKDFTNDRKLADYDGTFTAGTFWVKLKNDGPQIPKEVYEAIQEAIDGDAELNIRAKLDEDAEQRRNWRGRRLRACQAAGELKAIAEQLGIDDGKHLPPEGGLPAVRPIHRIEVENAIAHALRLLLIFNDGNVSPYKLEHF